MNNFLCLDRFSMPIIIVSNLNDEIDNRHAKRRQTTHDGHRQMNEYEFK